MARPSGQDRFAATKHRWIPFAPRFEETIQPEFYRWAARVRVYVVSALIFFDLITGLQAERVGFDPDVYWSFQAVNIPILMVDVALGWLLWRGHVPLRAMPHVNRACIVLEAASTLGSGWLMGSVSSHMVVVGMLLVLIYRAFFDFDTGVFTLALVAVGGWVFVLLESTNVIPIAPLLGRDPMGMSHEARQGSMLLITLSQLMTFVVTNIVVARINNKELAIRILRENLAAVEPGEVGRHTGRVLCATYELGRLAGTGGMGEVYRGRHLRTRRPVAVKLLHAQLLDDPSLLKRFRREAEITGTLGSEHIVEILDIDQDDDQPFIVLELLEGSSLAARIAERGPLPFDVVERIVGETASGLAVAHAAGVVHRDLKPGNLYLVERDGRETVKILDFGVSKIQGQATAITRELALLGTPDFMSPEQTVGVIDDVDARTDIFALGAIAYNALTGTKPFMASSIPALLRRICDEEPLPPRLLRPDLPEAVEDVLAIAMAKRAEQRYGDANELARDLAAALRDELPAIVRERAAAVHRGAPASQNMRFVGAAATDETLQADASADTAVDGA